MDIQKIYHELSLTIDKENLHLKAEMKDFTSFKCGGKCELLICPKNIEELTTTIKLLSKHKIKHLVMGNGTNILVKDSGYSGVIIKLGQAFSRICIEENYIQAGAGALLSEIAKKALEASLEGFEFASGIPGSIGGGTFMNAGAYDGELSKVVESVLVLSANGEKLYTVSKENMELSYRHSIFQETGDIIISISLSLQKGEKEKIEEKMKDLTTRRTEKQPLDFPSAGSFFKRPVGGYASKLIHDAGLRGLALGGAQVSPLHAGFIINTGNATTSDIINLMEIVRNTVYKESGIMLEPEVRIVGD